jgi:predicted metal-dependent phosphoesterase TrpH
MLRDLHSHTTCSDGQFSPAELLDRAAAAGVDMLAITDHDNVAAFSDIDDTIHENLTVIRGIELSTTWRSMGIHVLGLNIDPTNPKFLSGVAQQTTARQQRAETIAEKLRRKNLDIDFAELAGSISGNQIGRPDFARYLVKSGQVSSEKVAFQKYLGTGKAGDVRDVWADLETVIDWIRCAGGTAVIAHPSKYKMTYAKLRALTGEFREMGGQGIELISGYQTADVTTKLKRLCLEHELLASCGSDFHNDQQPWAQLGKFPELPEGCRPVWDAW